MAGSGTLADIMNPYQFSSGVMPTPGTPAYEEMLRNVMAARTSGQAGSSAANTADLQSRAVSSARTLADRGISFGAMSPWLSSGSIGGAAGGGAGGGAGSSSSSSSSSSPGAGLMEEILGLIRGTGSKEFGAARDRLKEDYGGARKEKISDLARRGLFRAGVGELELQKEIDQPYSRGLSDLASQQSDANTDLSLRKAAILGDIEAQARKAQAESAAKQYAQASQTGTGAYTMNPSAGSSGGGSRTASGDGSGGIFGAQFAEARSRNPAIQNNLQSGQQMYTPQQMQAGLASGSMKQPGGTGTNSYGGGGGEAGGGLSVPQLGIAGGAQVTNRYSSGTNAYTGSAGYRDTATGAWLTPNQLQSARLLSGGTVAPNREQTF